MPLPNGPVSICNIASDYIGAERVANIESPETDTEKIYSRHYEMVVQETMRDYIPNFAKRRANILLDPEAPIMDYANAYILPNDCIRVINVGGDREEYQRHDFDIQDGKILIDNDGALDLPLRYVAYVEDVTKWDAQFKTLVAMKLALSVLVQVVDDVKKAAFLTNELDKKIANTYGIGAQETPTRVINESPIIARRRNGIGYGRDTRYHKY